jgi:hypothetical protein
VQTVKSKLLINIVPVSHREKKLESAKCKMLASKLRLMRKQRKCWLKALAKKTVVSLKKITIYWNCYEKIMPKGLRLLELCWLRVGQLKMRVLGTFNVQKTATDVHVGYVLCATQTAL